MATTRNVCSLMDRAMLLDGAFENKQMMALLNIAGAIRSSSLLLDEDEDQE